MGPNGPFCPSNLEMKLRKRKKKCILITWQECSDSEIYQAVEQMLAKPPLGTRLCKMNVSQGAILHRERLDLTLTGLSFSSPFSFIFTVIIYLFFTLCFLCKAQVNVMLYGPLCEQWITGDVWFGTETLWAVVQSICSCPWNSCRVQSHHMSGSCY